MKLMNRNLWIVLPGFVLLAHTCFAEWEADRLWNHGVDGLVVLAAEAAAWRPHRFKLPVVTNPLDFDQLERKLHELNKNIDMAITMAQDSPPGLGLGFENEKQPRVVTALLFNGKAARAGIRRGDEIVKVNGKDVANYMDIIQLAQQNSVVVLTLKREVDIPVEKQKSPSLSQEFLNEMKATVGRFRMTLNILEQQAQNPNADLETLAFQGSALDSGINKLGNELQEAQIKLYNDSYHREMS